MVEVDATYQGDDLAGGHVLGYRGFFVPTVPFHIREILGDQSFGFVLGVHIKRGNHFPATDSDELSAIFLLQFVLGGQHEVWCFDAVIFAFQWFDQSQNINFLGIVSLLLGNVALLGHLIEDVLLAPNQRTAVEGIAG